MANDPGQRPGPLSNRGRQGQRTSHLTLALDWPRVVKCGGTFPWSAHPGARSAEARPVSTTSRQTPGPALTRPTRPTGCGVARCETGCACPVLPRPPSRLLPCSRVPFGDGRGWPRVPVQSGPREVRALAPPASGFCGATFAHTRCLWAQQARGQCVNSAQWQARPLHSPARLASCTVSTCLVTPWAYLRPRTSAGWPDRRAGTARDELVGARPCIPQAAGSPWYWWYWGQAGPRAEADGANGHVTDGGTAFRTGR